MSQGLLNPISEAAVMFLETAFSTKLDNNTHKAKTKVNGTNDLQWIQCAKLNPVVSAHVLGQHRQWQLTEFKMLG